MSSAAPVKSLTNAAVATSSAAAAAAQSVDPFCINVTASTFASGPPYNRVLTAFLVLSESGKTVRVLYTNPGPKHIVTNRFQVQQFAFPCTVGCRESSLAFTFVLTNSDGERMFGHTLHTVTGEALVCLSAYPWVGFFQHIMHLYRVNGGEEHGKRMIRLLLECVSPNIPAPGQVFPSLVAGRKLNRPLDNISAFVDTSPAVLLHVFSREKLLETLAALLCERRVVVIGPTFGAVSGVILSLLALLAPFEWQHILIPVLPQDLGLVLASPTPYIIGLVDSQVGLLETTPIETLVVVRLSNVTSRGRTELVCQSIEYYEEKPLQLPHTGITSRIRWQLELLRLNSSGSRSFEAELENYQTHDSRDSDKTHLEACQIFVSYYASWIGPAIAWRLGYHLAKKSNVECPAVHLDGLGGGEGISTASSASPNATTVSASEEAFFTAFIRSQCYSELIDRLVGLLSLEPPKSPQRHRETPATSWKDNAFLVHTIQLHAHLFPLQMEQLGQGKTTGSSSSSSLSSERYKTKSKGGDVARRMEERVRVRSLFYRTLACCTAPDDDDDRHYHEMHGLTPSSSQGTV